MKVEEGIAQLAKDSVMDLVYLHYDKLKAEQILNDETEELIKEILELNVYEFDDESGFGVPIVLDKVKAELFLYFEAETNAQKKTEVTRFCIETIDA